MLGAATRGTKQQPTGLIAYPAAQGRPVSGCGSQRMLHALERRSHPTDHGPSFASLYSPFCRYATSSPDRGKSLLAGGGQLNCNSRTGQIKNALAQCAKTATTLDIPSRWDPRANQSPTGALVAVLRTAALFDSRMGQIKNPPSECSRDFYDPYGNRTHVTAVKGPCLNRLTNGPHIIQDFAKTASNLSATIATDPQVF